jgi:hypothetical protein
MAAQRRNMPEQEHSIKARSHELFVDDTPVGTARATKPFKVVLRETPAQPLSPLQQAMLWVFGIAVAMLFLVALWRVAHRHHGKPTTDRSAADSAISTEVRRPSQGGYPPS